MVWTTPLTAVANAALTAAQWNASVRDNLLETAAAKATTAGRIFVATGANTLAERSILGSVVDATESTTAVTYTDLATAGPQVTLTTGTKALLWITAQAANTSTASSVASYGVSGASSLPPLDVVAIVIDSQGTGASIRSSACDLRSVTAGVNTFYMQYRVSGGTGSFTRRRIQVMGL